MSRVEHFRNASTRIWDSEDSFCDFKFCINILPSIQLREPVPRGRGMRVKRLTWFILMVGLLIVAVQTFAHHGAQAYDQQTKLTLKGTITSFEWTNPHSQIHLDVSDDKGSVVQWSFETQPPNVLVHAGWTRNSLQPGDQVTIVGNPAKNGAPVGIIQKVILANGQELTPNPR
jgi:hypothetical protein